MMRFPSEKSEILFSNPNTDFAFFLDNPKTETKLNTDPPTPTGVAAIYIKRTLISILRWDMTLKMMLSETCWVEIDLCNGQNHILVGCI